MGHYFHPNSHAIWGIFHPIYLLLSMRHLPSHTFSKGHPFFPFLAAYHCTLHLPSLRGVQIHTGHLSIPFHYCLPKGRHSEAAHEKRLLCAQKCTRGGMGWGWGEVGWGGVGHVGVGWGGWVM